LLVDPSAHEVSRLLRGLDPEQARDNEGKLLAEAEPRADDRLRAMPLEIIVRQVVRNGIGHPSICQKALAIFP
jgi:hypothetical protein